MLAFAQLPYLLLSDTALGFWTALLQQAAPRGESVAKVEKPPLPLDVAGALIDLAGGFPTATCNLSWSMLQFNHHVSARLPCLRP